MLRALRPRQDFYVNGVRESVHNSFFAVDIKVLILIRVFLCMVAIDKWLVSLRS